MKTTARMLLEKQHETINILIGSVIGLMITNIGLFYMLITK